MSRPSSRKRRLLRAAAALLVLALLAFLGTELFARFYLGLGTPALSVAHPTIEYMFKPNQDLYRFGNHIHINAYGMRADDFPKQKTDPDELRIFVLGDSVPNGANLTDQADLCTSVAERELRKKLDRPVRVFQASAGSWGIPNMLAYVKEYGLFDADHVVIILSSHDYADAPTFAPLNPSTHPTRTPFCATWEGATRYLPRYLPSLGSSEGSEGAEGAKKSEYANDVVEPAEINQAMAALTELVALIRQSGATVTILQHPTREEAETGTFEPGHAIIAENAAELGVETVDLQPAFEEAINAGKQPYRDTIHPNREGQKVIGDLLTGRTVSDARPMRQSGEANASRCELLSGDLPTYIKLAAGNPQRYSGPA